jgi:hypothetical protein
VNGAWQVKFENKILGVKIWCSKQTVDRRMEENGPVWQIKLKMEMFWYGTQSCKGSSQNKKSMSLFTKYEATRSGVYGKG